MSTRNTAIAAYFALEKDAVQKFADGARAEGFACVREIVFKLDGKEFVTTYDALHKFLAGKEQL